MIDQNSTNNKWLGIGLVASVVLVAILVLPTLVSWPTISNGGWLVAGLLIAALTVFAGEILIKKNALTATSEKVARVISIALGLLVAAMTVVTTWTWGLPANIFTLPTVAGLVLMGIILNGLYWEMHDGTGTISKVVFRLAVVLLIFGALLVWLIGGQLLSQSGQVLQTGARSQFSAWLNGQPTTNYNFNIGWLALGFFGLILLMGLWTKDKVPSAIFILAAVIWLPLVMWMAWGALPAEFKADVQSVAAPVADTFKAWTKPAPPPAPKLATDNRSDLGDFAPIFLGPDQERVLIKYQDDALCYYPVPGLVIWHRFEEPTAWFPGFDNNAWAIKLKNNTNSTIEVQAWREAGSVCNSR